MGLLVSNTDSSDGDQLDTECVQIRIIPSKSATSMSEIFGKIFGKDKHTGHKDKVHGSGDKISVSSTKWSDFCKYHWHFLISRVHLYPYTCVSSTALGVRLVFLECTYGSVA